MSFASNHNDYLDPDRWDSQEEPPEWWDVMEENCRLFLSEFSSKTWFDFYRVIYKDTSCGPSIGVLCAGSDKPVYCDNLRDYDADQPVVQVYVSSIVEGSESGTETHVIDMKVEGALARFLAALEAVDKEAGELWEEANREDSEDGQDETVCACPHGRCPMKVHHVPAEVDSAIMSLCESIAALLEHADMGEIHDDDTRDAVERAKSALAAAHALRLCVAQ